MFKCVVKKMIKLNSLNKTMLVCESHNGIIRSGDRITNGLLEFEIFGINIHNDILSLEIPETEVHPIDVEGLVFKHKGR